MTDYSLNDRWQENRSAWKAYWDKFTLEKFAIALIVFAMAIVGFGYFNQHGGDINWTNIFGDFYANVSSELISIVITVLVLERLNARRQDKQELTRLKALLGSNEAVVTKIAIAELRARGWLEDGSLRGANLQGANLQGADLKGASLKNLNLRLTNLQGAYMWHSNLQGSNLSLSNLQLAKLWQTNLRDTDLTRANLKNTFLDGVNLQNAILKQVDFQSVHMKRTNLQFTDLSDSNLQDSNLFGSDIQNANLANANFRGAYLTRAKIDKISWTGKNENRPATLPDGTQWSEEVDMEKFTNPEHPDYRATLAKIEAIRQEIRKENR